MGRYMGPSKRIMTELKILTINPDVRSYFHYESSEDDVVLKRFCIYGYLLPHIEPYKYGSFKVRITFPAEFPFKEPQLELLTYIYHSAIDDDISAPRFCNKCFRSIWTPRTRISQWLQRYVNIIDRPDADDGMYCVRNPIAKEQYHHNRIEYEQKALAMVTKYSYPRPNQTILSLKCASKQIICRQLHFTSAKINQLPLPSNLKRYLNS